MTGVLGIFTAELIAEPLTSEPLPLTCTIHTDSSYRDASGLFLDVDLCSTDWVGTWQLRAVELVDVLSNRVVLRMNAFTAGFTTDGRRTVLGSGTCITAVIPVPPGIAHRDLLLRVSAKNGAIADGISTVELPVSQSTLASIEGSIAVELVPGTLAQKQETFFAAWAMLTPVLENEGDKDELYAALKAAHLSGKTVSP